ncbi:etoposide-induced protein 2.4-domain-containing protein [Paraphysoderma sedebokerense]|nr:etoposide-induced protein 2.4-domain-containing protein [Paraphysoderma sedebokerense]
MMPPSTSSSKRQKSSSESQPRRRKYPTQIRQKHRTSSEPTGLSFSESIQFCILWFWEGVKDAFAFGKGLVTIYSSKKIQFTTLKCIILNGVIFLGSILFFDQVIMRILHFVMNQDLVELLQRVRGVQSDTHNGNEKTANGNGREEWIMNAVDNVLWWVYNILWIYPIYCISFILNTIWYQDIADRSYVLQVGKPVQNKATYSSVLNSLITNLYRFLLIFNLFLLATVVYIVPIIGPPLSFIYVSWIYSFYSFEYKWVNRGWGLEERCSYFEERWCYFSGFGFPFTLFTFFFPQIISGGIFALLFPMYIIMANAATPLPRPGTRTKPLPQFHSLVPLRLPIFRIPKKMSGALIGFVRPRKKRREEKDASDEDWEYKGERESEEEEFEGEDAGEDESE